MEYLKCRYSLVIPKCSEYQVERLQCYNLPPGLHLHHFFCYLYFLKVYLPFVFCYDFIISNSSTIVRTLFWYIERVVIVNKAIHEYYEVFRMPCIFLSCRSVSEDHVLKRHKCYCNHSIVCFFHIPDINECDTDNGGCDHNCTDSIGSYDCSCDIGYILATDNHGCGKSKNIVKII